jgi:diguanylate cyclase (GGDEF)-like protein/PAS domain S-box-containing protein
VLSALESLKGAKEMHFALRGKDGNGAKGEAFWGDPQLFEGNPVTTMVSIPGGSWQLAVSPAAGWQTNPYSLLILEGIGLLLIALLTLLLLSYHEGRQHTAASERRLRAFLETSQDAIIVTDDTGLIQEFNPTAELLFGYTKDEMTGTSINRLMAQRDATTHDHHLAAAKGLPPHHMAQQREIQGRRKDGTMVPLEITVGQTLVDNKTIFVGAIRDISDRKALEQRLLELASTDPLTQAANRRAFLTTATQSLQEAKRHGRGWSMLMLDADHFKRINDSHGHQTGDLVLQQLAQTMRDCLRESDILGRFGGEEFAIALPETSSKQAESLAARLLDAVRELRIQASNGQTIQVTVSIGIASLGAETEDLESLTKQADDALYAAKADGRNRYCSAVDMPMLL